MTTNYQVCARYTLRRGRLQLAALSLHSTSEYIHYYFRYITPPLTVSTYFHTIPQARRYISHLLSRYPKCGLPQPVLDSDRLTLF